MQNRSKGVIAMAFLLTCVGATGSLSAAAALPWQHVVIVVFISKDDAPWLLRLLRGFFLRFIYFL